MLCLHSFPCNGHRFDHCSDLLLVATQELSLLQDQVPAFSSARAVSTVEQELGAPVTQLFRFFDQNPIAAASLGQARIHTSLRAESF